MRRRNFIKQSCFACGALMAGVSIVTLESCSASKNVTSVRHESGSLLVPLDLFAEEKVQVVRSENLKNDVLVVTDSDNVYRAFLMKCTHKGASLKLDSEAIKCSLHGSRFNFNGEVMNGPAKENLQSFPTTIKGKNIMIKIS